MSQLNTEKINLKVKLGGVSFCSQLPNVTAAGKDVVFVGASRTVETRVTVAKAGNALVDYAPLSARASILFVNGGAVAAVRVYFFFK